MDAILGPKRKLYQWNLEEQYKEHRKTREGYEWGLRWNKASTIVPTNSGKGYFVRKDIKANNGYPEKSILQNSSFGTIIEENHINPIQKQKIEAEINNNVSPEQKD